MRKEGDREGQHRGGVAKGRAEQLAIALGHNAVCPSLLLQVHTISIMYIL